VKSRRRGARAPVDAELDGLDEDMAPIVTHGVVILGRNPPIAA
jgi:hypothetical protein